MHTWTEGPARSVRGSENPATALGGTPVPGSDQLEALLLGSAASGQARGTHLCAGRALCGASREPIIRACNPPTADPVSSGVGRHFYASRLRGAHPRARRTDSNESFAWLNSFFYPSRSSRRPQYSRLACLIAVIQTLSITNGMGEAPALGAKPGR